MFVACEGERDSIHPRVPGGDGGRSTLLAADASRRKFGGISTNVLSANSLKPIVYDPSASTAGGRQYISIRCGRVLKVLRVKRVVGSQNSGAPKCKFTIGLHTLMIH